MSDHNLYLLHAANSTNQAALIKQENLAILKENGFNPSLALTFSGASQSLKLSINDQINASKNAMQARLHANLAIEQYRSRKAKKQAIAQEIKDLESVRKDDEKELKILRINRHGGDSTVELSDRRKLYYNAAKAMQDKD